MGKVHITKMSPCDQVRWSLKHNPNEWEHKYGGAKTLVNKRTGTEVWVENGFWFYGIWRDNRESFSFLGKIKFWFTYTKWRLATKNAKEYEDLGLIDGKILTDDMLNGTLKLEDLTKEQIGLLDPQDLVKLKIKKRQNDSNT